jgi:phosphoglycerol transferase MdoB-like AlkP superfamily enzyme
MESERNSTKIVRRKAAIRNRIALYRPQAKPLTILLVCCTLVATSYSDFMLGVLNQFGSIYSFCLFVMLSALLLPKRLVVLTIPLAFGSLMALSYLNEVKISAVSLPITFFDVKAVIADPSVLVNAVGMREDFQKMIAAIVGVLLSALFAFIFYKSRENARQNSSKASQSMARGATQPYSFVVNAATFLVILIAAHTYLGRYGRFVHANLSTHETKLWQNLWLPSSQAALSRKLGVLEYVAFSSFAGNDETDISLAHGPDPTAREVRVAAARFVKTPVLPPRALLPNIVLFHAESTFDPNLAFRLSARFELPLWSRQTETRALGPLRVNIIGGGSWVTEFEVITGVDSRMFGYQGYYTHFYIAPKVKNSLAVYLANKGYKTAAFYPVEGNFYNAENAFKSYGFQQFSDGPALGLPNDWGRLIDREIITAVIDYGAFKRSGPFFYFISTSENHGPHPCRSFVGEEQFLTTFAVPASFEKNCQLNEFLRRAKSTSTAFELVLKELRQIERQTGRPFVLLIYGDHQPWSFTGGVYSIAGGTAAEQGFKNFSDVRTNADAYQTFFHLLASDNAVVRTRFTKPPPVWLLPTVVSAFVANSYGDLYLPINFLAFANCGSAIASGCARYAEIARWARGALLKEPSLQTLPAGVPLPRVPRLVEHTTKLLPQASYP